MSRPRTAAAVSARTIALALRRYALAVVALVLSAGAAGVFVPSLPASAPSDGARVAVSVDGARASQVSDSSHALGHGDDADDPDLKVVEADLDDDDDDDPAHQQLGHGPVAFRLAPRAPKPECVVRAERVAGAARFVAGRGLPRGPPTA